MEMVANGRYSDDLRDEKRWLFFSDSPSSAVASSCFYEVPLLSFLHLESPLLGLWFSFLCSTL